MALKEAPDSAGGVVAEAAGLADLAEANLGALDDGGDVFDAQGGAGLSLEDSLLDVVRRFCRGRPRGR